MMSRYDIVVCTLHSAKWTGPEVQSGITLLNKYVELTPYTPFHSHTPIHVSTLDFLVFISWQCVAQ